MQTLFKPGFYLLCAFSFLIPGQTQSQNLSGSTPTAALSQAQIVERAYPAVAMVLASESPTETASVGTALAVRENGILLTAYHVIRDANAVQVRLKSGEVFDQVQLLGVDERRDIAAIRITASGLTVLPVAGASTTNPGDPITTISHPQALPWSASSGVVSALRMADEVPGAGSGYRIIQFTAPSSPGLERRSPDRRTGTCTRPDCRLADWRPEPQLCDTS